MLAAIIMFVSGRPRCWLAKAAFLWVRIGPCRVAAQAMMRHIGKPEDTANVGVSFLASPESGFLTAQVLTVDGRRMDFTRSRAT